MPFFGIKIMPKKTPIRKVNQNENIEELFDESRAISIKLGEQETVFENGEWIAFDGSAGDLQRSSQRLRNDLHQLQEENNMLRLKYEMLLNMLTQTTAENHLQKREIEKLKSNQRNK